MPDEQIENLGLALDRHIGLDYVTQAGSDFPGRFDNNRHGNDEKPDTRVTLGQRQASRADLARRLHQQEALTTARGGRMLRFNATSRCVTGLGETSPLHVGLHLDWTLGWPTLPATSLKGATRAWVEHWATEEDLARTCGDLNDFADYYASIFGAGPLPDDAEMAEGWVGDVLWLDGLFEAKGDGAPLVRKVMTPHYAKWLLEGPRDPAKPEHVPGDWNEPTPLVFLAVDKGAVLQTALLPRIPEAAVLLDVAEAWMRAALMQIGVGGKTKDGLGRFA